MPISLNVIALPAVGNFSLKTLAILPSKSKGKNNAHRIASNNNSVYYHTSTTYSALEVSFRSNRKLLSTNKSFLFFKFVVLSKLYKDSNEYCNLAVFGRLGYKGYNEKFHNFLFFSYF